MRPIILLNRYLLRIITCSKHFSSSSPLDNISNPVAVNLERFLDPLPAEHARKRAEKFESPSDSRIAKTVILGLPNAGKSVLTNALVDAPISAVSSKVHTTRKTTRGACLLNERTQLLVLDTPGVVTSSRAKKHKLEDSLLTDPEGAMYGADAVCVLVDAADRITRDRLDPRILHLLYRHRHRLLSALVFTKVDRVKDKSLLLDLGAKLTKGVVGGKQIPAKEVDRIFIRNSEKTGDKDVNSLDQNEMDLLGSEKKLDYYDKPGKGRGRSEGIDGGSISVDEMLRKYWTDIDWEKLEKIATLPWPQIQESQLQKCYRDEIGWPLFDRIFMVSALNGQGVEEMKSYLNERARNGKWRFHPTLFTDQDEEQLVKDIVRAKLMDRLMYHIPYTLNFKICVWEINPNDVLCIRMDVVCQQDRDARFIIGPKGSIVSETAHEVTQVLRNLFQREVFFRMGVYTSKRKDKK